MHVFLELFYKVHLREMPVIIYSFLNIYGFTSHQAEKDVEEGLKKWDPQTDPNIKV